MNTCRQSGVRQHKSTAAAGIHDDISTPGGRWASHGGGGASDVDAPGSNFKFYWERTSNLVLEGIMLKSSLTLFALARTPGNMARERRGCCRGSRAGYLPGICAAASPCWQWVVCCLRQSWCDILTWLRWPVRHAELLLFVLSICFSFLALDYFILAIGWKSLIFSEQKNEGEHVWTRHQSALCFVHFDFHFRFSMLFGHALTCFGAAIENDLFLVSGSKLTRFLCRGNDIDLILGWGSKLASFQWWRRD